MKSALPAPRAISLESGNGYCDSVEIRVSVGILSVIINSGSLLWGDHSKKSSSLVVSTMLLAPSALFT